MNNIYNNRDAWKIKTTNGRRSLESRVCGMNIELAEAVLRGDIGINTAIKQSRDEYEYHASQQDQISWFKQTPCKKECIDGRGWSNASDKNMTRRGHQN